MDLHDKTLHFTAKRIETLERLHLYTTDDLLSYYPFRYDVLSVKPFAEWKIKERITFEAVVVSPVKSWRHGRMTTSSFDVQAQDHILKVTIFNRPWARNLTVEQTITITGIFMGGSKVTAISYDTKSLEDHSSVTPVYSTKEGIQQRTIRDSIQKVLNGQQNELPDMIPEVFRLKYKLLRRYDALRRIHTPASMDDVTASYRTLKYEEFLKFFTAVKMLKDEEGNGIYKQPRIYDADKVQEAVKALPFPLTKDQQTALNDILKDMSSTKAMYRLVQGDVGCGKTVVAAMAMYACATAGYQSALLAPTEILAQQHFLSLQNMLGKYGIRIAVLYSGLPASEKEEIIQGIQDGSIDAVIGTHSLLQDVVQFHQLGLVVADEQQRFGVDQRRKLKEKGNQADFLLMSATPIPRTLASTLFGDMDISTIETMPSGRQAPVTTYIHENSFRSVLDQVKELLQNGRQLYVICAAVDANEDYDARNVVETTVNLKKLFSQYHVGCLHGRMSSEEKQQVMSAFGRNEIQILVCTTVVEVGMNVVNATGMIVYDADRFGLSQLHQLRGRIQRGSVQGQCWLLSGSQEDRVRERLEVLVRSNNGFEISYEDLRLRGPGDILGTRQSGVPDFILGNVIEDTGIIQAARSDAETIMKNVEDPQYAAILDWVRKRNENSSVYAD